MSIVYDIVLSWCCIHEIAIQAIIKLSNERKCRTIKRIFWVKLWNNFCFMHFLLEFSFLATKSLKSLSYYGKLCTSKFSLWFMFFFFRLAYFPLQSNWAACIQIVCLFWMLKLTNEYEILHIWASGIFLCARSFYGQFKSDFESFLTIYSVSSLVTHQIVEYRSKNKKCLAKIVLVFLVSTNFYFSFFFSPCVDLCGFTFQMTS